MNLSNIFAKIKKRLAIVSYLQKCSIYLTDIATKFYAHLSKRFYCYDSANAHIALLLSIPKLIEKHLQRSFAVLITPAKTLMILLLILFLVVGPLTTSMSYAQKENVRNNQSVYKSDTTSPIKNVLLALKDSEGANKGDKTSKDIQIPTTKPPLEPENSDNVIQANKPIKLKIKDETIKAKKLRYIVEREKTHEMIEVTSIIDDINNQLVLKPKRAFRPGKYKLQVVENIDVDSTKNENVQAKQKDANNAQTKPSNNDQSPTEQPNTDRSTTDQTDNSLDEQVNSTQTTDSPSQQPIYEQEFLWGVLAYNSDKAQYLLYETAQFQIGVLDEQGNIICDADIDLTITNKDANHKTILSTKTGTITESNECIKHDFTLEPDYKSELQLTHSGKYTVEITATTKNGTYKTTDSFEVIEPDDVPFLIQRNTPTRVYPKKDYPVEITIIPNEDFNGEIVETVPRDFLIKRSYLGIPYTNIQKTSGDKKIIWKIKLEKDVPVILSYKYDAPNISPQFYLLGPIEFVRTTETTTLSDEPNQDTDNNRNLYKDNELDNAKDKNNNKNADKNNSTKKSDNNQQTKNKSQQNQNPNQRDQNKIKNVETIRNIDIPSIDLEPNNTYASKVTTNKKVIFTEQREWQLANDAIDDYAIYTDTNGTHDTDNSSYTGVPFNNQVAQGGIFTQNANDIDVGLGSDGHYLFGYVIQARNDSYGNRISYLSRVTLDETENLTGHGQGYRRNATNDRYYTYGYGIVNASSGDNIRVEVIRQGDNTASHTLEANRSSFWLVKLDDDWAYLKLQGQDNQSTSTSLQDINFTTSIENTDTDTFGHSTSTNSNQITLKSSGHYLVTYSVGVDGATSRTSVTTNLALNGTAIPQSYDYSYIRSLNSTTHGTATNMSIINASANDVLTLKWGATGAHSSYGTQTRSDRTFIAVVKLPDDGDYLMAHDTSGTQNVGGLNNTLTFDTSDEADSTSFSFSTSTGTATIQQDDTYLFMSGARSNRTTGTARLTSAGLFYVNGTQQSVGNTGVYVRGDQGTPDTFDGGWTGAGIFDLSQNDQVTFRQVDEGDNGGDDKFVANALGLTAINLDTILIPVTNDSPNAPQTPYVNNDTAQSGQASPVSNLTDITPAFSAIYDDNDASDTAPFYQIQVGDDTDWSDAPELWDSNKSSLTTAVNENSRSEDIIYNGTALTAGSTYYWRIKFWDNNGAEGAWSATQQFSMATNNDPNAPQTPYANNDTAQSGQVSPVYNLTDTTPAFSAIYDDDDTTDKASYYQLQVGDDTDWSDAPELWDSTKTAFTTSLDENSRSDDIIYGGSALTLGSTYYWRIKFWDNRGGEGAWSATQQFSLASSVGNDGDVAIYQDTNGTHNTNNTSYTGVPFNNVVTQDPTFSQNANDIDVKLVNGGHYLVGYKVEAQNTSYGNRIGYLSRLLLNSTEELSAHGQGYRRDATNNRYYAYGYGIISANASNNIRVEVIRNGTNSAEHDLIANKSSFWLAKLTDSWAYLRLQGQDNQTTSTSLQDINFTTSIENSDTNTFGHSTSTNSNQITLKQAGHYLVTYNVGIDSTTDRTSITTNLALNGTAIPQSYGYAYARGLNGATDATASNITIINASVNDILTLEWGATGAYATNGSQTRSDRTSIQIVKLPDTGDYLRIHENTDGQDIGGLNNTITFDTSDEADANSFTYSTSTSQTTINKGAFYIFTSGARTHRTTGGTRLTSKGAFFIDGTQSDLANTGTYIRGVQSPNNTLDGGWSAGGILSLSKNNVVDFRQIDEGGNGDDDKFVANSYGITAVNLNSFYTISISGTCQQYDESTNCANGETVKVAVDGQLQSQTTTTSSGTFTISGIPKPAKNSVITVFLDNVSDSNEAVTITKYAGSGDISNLKLYEEHLTLGNESNTSPISNSDVAKYDNSVSSDEDIFFDVDSSNNLTVDYTAQSTQEKLYVLANNTFRPDDTNATTVTTEKVKVDGGLTLDQTTFKITGSGTGSSVPITFGSNGILTANSPSTVEFSGTSATEIPALTYYNLKLAPSSGSPTHTLGTATSQTIDINGSLTIGDSTNTVTADLGTYSPAININKSLIVNSNATMSGSYSNTIKTAGSVTGGGVINISGTGSFENNASANVSFGSSTGSNNWSFSNLAFTNSVFTPVTITLNSGGTGTIQVTNTLTIGNSADTETTILDNETNDRNLDLVDLTITDKGEFKASSTSTQKIAQNFTNNGTFTPNNSTIEFDDSTKTSKLLYSSNTTFYNLTVNTDNKQIQFDETEQTNITGTLTLQGSACGTSRVLVDSTTDNDQFDINATGSTTTEYVDIEDSNAVTALTARNATEDNGGNTNWTIIAGSCGSNTPPNDPTSLTQAKTDDTVLNTGDYTNETSIKFSASASDTDNPDGLKLCVEIQPVGTAFTGTSTQCSDEQTYTGSALTLTTTISGLDADESYHWQAKITDTANSDSNWVSYGGNLETARDVGIDTTAPTVATIYDGDVNGVDKEISSSSLSELSANWDNFDATVSGIKEYEYSIGLTQGGTEILGWTSNGTSTSVTATGLTLQTSKVYYFNVRATDNASNISNVASSDGQIVAPSLQFSVTPPTVEFSNLNALNGYSAEQTATLTTSTNAYNGYEIRAFLANLLTSSDGVNTIQNFDGGTYSAPASWDSSDRGFGYTSSDTSIQGVDKFNSSTCAGGGAAPCYAPFATSSPGDIVADHESTVSGSAISNEQFNVTYKVQTDSTQPASKYSTTVIYAITAKY